jgi:chitinase
MKLTGLKRMLKSAVTILAAIISTGLLGQQSINGTTNKRIITYYGDWVHYAGQDNFEPSQLPLTKLTHINYAFIDLEEDGSVSFLDTYAAFEKTFGEAWDSDHKGVIGQFRKLRQQFPNTRFGFSIGGWSRSHNFPVVAASAEKRSRFAQACVKLLRDYGFDFIDIDWEYPGLVREPDKADNPNDMGHLYGTESDGENYVLLLKEVRAALDKAGQLDGRYYELCAAVPAGQDKMEDLDISGMNKYLDFFNIMTYDLHGAYEPVTGHHAALDKNPEEPYSGYAANYYGKFAIQYYLDKGVPASKISVGSPTYSRGWANVQDNGPIPELPGLFASASGGAPGKRDGGVAAGNNNYYDLLAMEKDPAYTKYRDPVNKMPYLYSKSKREFYTYEDEVSAQYRADYVKTNNLGGIIMWQASGDGPSISQRDSITSVFKTSFYGSADIPAREDQKPSVRSRWLAGYLHNWISADAGGYLPLNEVPDDYDVIHIAFVDIASDGTVTFTDGGKTTPIVTKEWILDKINAGKIVTFSAGGANAAIVLDSSEKIQRFADSFIKIIEEYGVNGIDIDIEHGLNAGISPGFPTAPVQGLIDAIDIILLHFGEDFKLFMAPESANVMGGFKNYGGAWGVYLPIIEHFKNRLTGLQVQFYNAPGGMFGLDDTIYYQATPENIVAMTDMLVKGFEVAYSGWVFSGIPAEKLMPGLPAVNSAAPAGGFVSEADVHKALTQLVHNEKLTSYSMETSHTNLKGLMTWSINWDKQNDWKFSKVHRAFLDGLDGVEPAPEPEPTPDPDPTPDPEPTPGADTMVKEIIIDDVIIRYEVATAWDSGHNFNITIINNSSREIKNWELSLVSDAINSTWNASMVKNGSDILIMYPSWQNSIAPGSSYPIGGGASGNVIDIRVVSLEYEGQETEPAPDPDPTPDPEPTPDPTPDPGIVPEYDANTVYTAGDQVSYNGHIYEAKWWTSGLAPDMNEAFKLVYNNSGTLPEWNASLSYNGGDEVSYNGAVYKAKWWTRGDTPDSFSVWVKQ